MYWYTYITRRYILTSSVIPERYLRYDTDNISYAREILRAIGVPPQSPTFIGSDNKANALIAAGIALPSRSRHCLRRYLTFLQRLRRGEVDVGHVPDVENPSDFLTKWVSREKTNASLEYATNFRNVVKAHGYTV